MMAFLKKIERLMILALILMMTIVLFLSIIELGWILAIDIISEPIFILEIRELLDIFGLFLLVLIGIELLDSIRTYVVENVIHVEVVLVVAMIAIARKVIILDIDKYSALTFVGIASLILALSVAYYLIKKTHKIPLSEPPEAEQD